MELMRLGEPGQELPVAREGGRYFDLGSITADIDGGFIGNAGIARVREALKAGLPELDGAESGDAPPSVPILFFQHPNTMVGGFDHVVIPPGAEKVDWEVELAVVIGKRAPYLASPEEALDYVAGYAVSNDVSERAFQVERSGPLCQAWDGSTIIL